MNQIDIISGGKLPPQAIELEEAVLGAFLLNDNSIDYTGWELLSPEIFYKDAHVVIAKALRSVKDRSDPVDMLTVIQELRKMGKLEDVGGAYYVSQLTNRVTSGANVEYHLRIIIEKAMMRSVIQVSSTVMQQAYDDTCDVFDVLGEFNKGMDAVNNKITPNSVVVAADLYVEFKKRNEIINQNKGVSGVPTGFSDLDKLTGGWQNSDLIIIAARPGQGKTSMALKFLTHPALNGYPTAIFSLEMSSIQLWSRIQSQYAEIHLSKIMRSGCNEYDLKAIEQKCKDVINAPIYFEDQGGQTVRVIMNKARKLKREKDIKLIIIDYLQLILPGEKKGSREQEVSFISGSMKQLAKELDIPIILLSQLSRAVEQRGGSKIPVLSDLRDSGSIEQDADLVGFIYRPEYYGITEDDQGESTAGKALLKIDKHRNGGLSDIMLRFDGKFTKFSDDYSLDDFGDEPNNPMQPNEDFL